MNKPKFILGIVITVCGGAVMLISMVFGIIHFADNLYRTVQILDIKLKSPEIPEKTILFNLQKGQNISVWLKYPDRQLENKNFKISLSFLDKNEVIPGKLGENFSAGYFRNSSGKGQYYWLGEHNFQKRFQGHLQYKIDGTYIPQKTAYLVLRQSLPFSLPQKQIAIFIAGIFVLIIGVGTIVKNSKKLESA